MRTSCRSASVILIPTALAIAPLYASSPAFAVAKVKHDDIEKSGHVLAYALPAAAGAISLFSDDREGVAELVVSYALTIGTAYGLKRIVKEERPEDSGDDSFPSGSTASAFAGASYLDKRYGWQFGLPAYALASYVGYSRVESRQHHWYDVVAGAAFGWGFNQLVTTEDEIGGVSVHPLLATDFVGLNLDMKW
jgi:membrane-associated phospholipid phosphatase